MNEKDLIPVELKREIMKKALADVERVGNQAREIRVVDSQIQINPALRSVFGETVRGLRQMLRFYEVI